MSYAIVCDGCGVIIAQIEAGQEPVFDVTEIWSIQLPGEVAKVHLCDEGCLARWSEKRRMRQIGSGELDDD